jgi:hypothetical protein
MSKTVFKLTDGTEADFDSKTPLSKVDEILAKNGLERDKSQKPFVEKEGIAGMTDEALAKTNYPIVQGAAGLGGLAGALQRGVEAGTGKIAELLGYTPEQAQAGRMAVRLPTPSDITRAVGDAGVPMQRAETIGGRAAQNLVRNVVSAPVAGAVVPSLLSAVGEEAVAYPFIGTPLESTARTAGALFTPLVPAPTMFRSPLERMYAESTKRVTPQELSSAERLQQMASRQQMPITSVEAIQQTTGGRTNLPALQRQLEANPASAPLMAEFMGSRGEETLSTLQRMFPQTGRERLGTEAQRAAEKTMARTQTELSTSPAAQSFEAVKSKAIPPSWMKNLENESAVISEASRAVDNVAAYQDLLKGYKGNSIARVEAMRQYLSDKYDMLAGQAGGAVTGEMRAYNEARKKLLEKADNQIPDYKTARESYFQAKEKIVAPVQESPISKIAKDNEVSIQFAEVFAKNPAAVNLTPQKVTMTMKSLAQADAALPKDFLTQYMRSSLEQVESQASRAAGTTGAKFANTIVKNTTQKENLRAAFKEVYGQSGDKAAQGLNNLIDILEAQGRRLPAGSPTAEKGMIAAESVSTISKATKNPLEALGNAYQTIFYRKDYENVAKAITSPDGIKILENMAKAGKNQKQLATGAVELQRLIDALDEGAE